jgi:SAM-dependent methyltransferase
MFYFWLVDDLYGEDRIGQIISHQLEKATHFYNWVGETVKGSMGARVLEIGAGIGNLSARLCQRDLYIASDSDEMFASRLVHRFARRPNVRTMRLDPTNAADIAAVGEEVDTVLCLNALETIQDEATALKNLNQALIPGGKLIMMVPQDEKMFGTLDQAIGRCRRYSRDSISILLKNSGFEIEKIESFNRVGMIGWWLNGKILKRQAISRIQLKLMDSFMWAIKRFDHLLPWEGLSLFVVARKV